MAFFKTHEPSEQFFRQFTDGATNKAIAGEGDRLFPMLPIPLFTGETKDFLVRYYNRSGQSAVEDVREFYPCIIIQDFMPVVDGTQIWDKDYLEGVYDEARGKRDYITLPVPMIFKYQVSAVTKRQKEASSVNDWFLDKFISNSPKFFEFNKFQTDDGFVADITPYRVEQAQVERGDGRFEYVYDFTLSTYIHAKAKSYIFVSEEEGFQGGNFKDTLEKLKVSVSIGDLEGLRKVLLEEFEIT